MGFQRLKCHQNQAQDTWLGRWGQFLSLGQGQVADRRPQPGSPAPHPSHEGEQTELPFPDIPGDTSKSTSLPTHVEAPALLRKANSYRQNSELSRATRRGKQMLQNPLQDSASSFPSLNHHHEALHYKAQTRATQHHHHSPPSH